MNKAIRDFAVDIIHERIGIAVHAGLPEDQPSSLDLSPADLHPNDSFTVRFSPGWRSVEVLFIPGKYSAPLIEQMGSASVEAQSVLSSFATVLDKRNIRLTFRVNGVDVSAFNATGFPAPWTRLELHARSAPQVIRPEDMAQMRRLVLDMLVPVFGMLAALIGVEEPEAGGIPEGTPYQTLVTRYERRKVNREACIQLKGTRCTACGFDFVSFYGELGFGYIEVHHTTPLSELGPDYRLNILTDLIPLCANCHAMVHRKCPPIPISELSALIEGKNRK